MKHEVSKINELKTVESFMQIDFIKGYKYVDKAGEILNEFVNNGVDPSFSMTMSELIVRKPQTLIETLKVSPNVVWAHFQHPDSLDQIATEFEKVSVRMCEILKVTDISRVGWRNYFIWELGKEGEEERDKILQKFIPNKELNFEVVSYTAKILSHSWTITLRKATKKADEPIPSLLFDVDCHRSFDSYTQPNRIKLELKEIREAIQSKEFLAIINSLLSA